MEIERSVALVHGCGLDPENHNQPDKVARLQILAAAELYRKRRIKKIIFTAGDSGFEHIKLAEVMADKLRKALPSIQSDDIVVIPIASSTRAEIKVLKDLSERNAWNYMVAITNPAQVSRVDRAISRIFRYGKIKPEIKNASDILMGTTTNKRSLYSRAIQNVNNSPEMKAVLAQSGMLDKIDSIPLVGGILLDMWGKIPFKNKIQTKIGYLLATRDS